MDELFIEAKLENLNTVLDFINARIKDYPARIQHHIGIAVDEIFSNIARYAYHPGAGSVAVRIAVDSCVTIVFEDNGIEFNPHSANTPDVSLPAEGREIGGLGIFIVKSLMDTVEYQREGNKNILSIKKSIARE